MEPLCAKIFSPYGKLVCAGAPEDHLIDAQIFRSIQNKATPPKWVKLAEPNIFKMKTAPFETTCVASNLTYHPWERTIIVPDTKQDHVLTVGLGQDGQPPTSLHNFLFEPGVAVNLKPCVWFSRLYSLYQDADYWIISGATHL
ncbi:hypothetical protein OAC22_00960 [bacterium]|nr:hypothetical protein [bacterium]